MSQPQILRLLAVSGLVHSPLLVLLERRVYGSKYVKETTEYVVQGQTTNNAIQAP